MRQEPSPRRDGKCAVCKSSRKRPNGKGDYTRHIRDYFKQVAADPFCSVSCCHAFHKVDIGIDGRAGMTVGRGQGRRGRRPTPRLRDWAA